MLAPGLGCNIVSQIDITLSINLFLRTNSRCDTSCAIFLRKFSAPLCAIAFNNRFEFHSAGFFARDSSVVRVSRPSRGPDLRFYVKRPSFIVILCVRRIESRKRIVILLQKRLVFIYLRHLVLSVLFRHFFTGPLKNMAKKYRRDACKPKCMRVARAPSGLQNK